MQLTGKVVHWRDDKGFGFVVPDNDTQQVFFHIRDFTDSKIRPTEGCRLQFSLSQDKQGRPLAIELQVISGSRSASPLAEHEIVDLDYTQDVALYFRCAFLVLVVIALLFGTLPYVLPILYIEASLFTYWLYRADKAAAKARQRQRLPEQSLQLFSLIGGWPGALLAQKKLSHKKRKFLFQREFLLVIVGNGILLIWLLSQHGQLFLGRLALWS
ncbi:MAG: DNA-binding protein [Rheinheimera sp.]|uniref:cold shock and DUF1294 domain-containing protein n=1 Tax=Arsukibacterium sp. UBA3155 TaxID=1946058 RepID=UPI000C944A1E|nr:cold shock and DUF1294 domain-containing protein [Arsukibacterium sp. UBA3155]MAD76628.1 DNA-binding protein [Rheinheimera sp.]|tara:strand:- start:53284 stop:53925 length:642 start_codon:yes stop_codon:yes gene_type:complete